MSSKGSLFIISAASGSGKTTLVNRVMRELPALKFSVSVTTRSPRLGEVEGADYRFVADSVFRKMIEEDAFLEYATVHGHFYGTSRAAVFADLEAGLDVLLDIDVQGARQVRSRMPETVSVFVLAPSLEELRRRLVGRGLDDEAVIEARLKVAREEIAAAGEYDFVIVNHDVEKASLELKSIFLAERCRTARRAGCVEVVLRTFE